MALTRAALSLSEVIIEVFRLNGLALAAGDRLGKAAKLTSARWQVLGVVDHEAAPVANVARMMGLTRQSVQVTADALEQEGFVEYVDNPHHRRAKLIAITSAGRKALRMVESRHAEWADQLGRRIDLTVLRATVDGLRAARAVFEQDAKARDD